MECTLPLECMWSGVGMYVYWWVIWPSPWSGILESTYDIQTMFGVYTPVGVVTEWLSSVHSKLECTLRQGKGIDESIKINCVGGIFIVETIFRRSATIKVKYCYMGSNFCHFIFSFDNVLVRIIHQALQPIISTNVDD